MRIPEAWVDRPFEVWHNLDTAGRSGPYDGYLILPTHRMRKVLDGTLLMPASDPSGASYMFRLLARQKGVPHLDDWEFTPYHPLCEEKTVPAHALFCKYHEMGLRPVGWGDLIVINTVTWQVQPNWRSQEHPTITGQAERTPA